MASVCLYFQVHQPLRIKKYPYWDIGRTRDYFVEKGETDLNNEKILQKVAHKSYLPANKILLDLLGKHSQFHISFSFSGLVLEQFEHYSPETLASFQALVDTGKVEILSETYYHSLSFLYSKDEFKRQIEQHKQKVKELFDYEPTVFRNTELIYNNELASFIEKMGYKGILSEGADHILNWRSPNFVYSPKGARNIKLLLKNYRLSDDIAFRFSSREWPEHPLTAPKFAQWVHKINGNGNVVNLFMDYETFGEHQWEDTGIFEFLYSMPEHILNHPDNDFVTPSQAIDKYNPVGEIDTHHFISWADVERDLSAWLENPMQQDAMEKLYSLEERILESQDQELIEDWRRLTTSDHFYYMCTKWFADGDVHKYFNPYDTPYDAFRYFMNVLSDINLRLEEKNYA